MVCEQESSVGKLVKLKCRFPHASIGAELNYEETGTRKPEDEPSRDSTIGALLIDLSASMPTNNLLTAGVCRIDVTLVFRIICMTSLRYLRVYS